MFEYIVYSLFPCYWFCLGEVGELFSKKVGKAAPGYDYSVVPDRVPDIKIPEEVDEMDERTVRRGEGYY